MQDIRRMRRGEEDGVLASSVSDGDVEQMQLQLRRARAGGRVNETIMQRPGRRANIEVAQRSVNKEGSACGGREME